MVHALLDRMDRDREKREMEKGEIDERQKKRERDGGSLSLFQGYFIENNPMSVNGAHAITASEP